MTLQPNDGNEGLDTAGEAAKPWRKEAFEPEWMKKLREKAPEAVTPADNARTAKPAEGRGRMPEKESPTVFRMSRADTRHLPEGVEARDLCSLGKGSARRYTAGVKMEALKYFERGWGYKATAGFLHLPYYTVREWKRLYTQGKFTRAKLEAEVSAVRDLFDAPEPANFQPDTPKEPL